MTRVVQAPSRAAATSRGPSRFLATAAAGAGPVLIVACVLVALRGFVFGDRLSNQHPDLLAFVLPRLSFLGRSLASGHVPLWNPFDMTGTPYAADPQSGWLYLPPMLLFSTLSPGAAMRAFIALNPMLAGIGAYAFLRKERLRRVAATVGGLSLAMAMSTSIVAIAMPFAGALAWTTVVLLGASGYTRAHTTAARLGWMALAAFAWGQVAGAHMSHGLGTATALVVAYLAGAAVREVRAGRTTPQRAGLLALGFLAFLPLANLAVFLPRLALAARSSLRGGYEALGAPLAQAAGIDERPIVANGVWSGWPLSLGSAPGASAGAVVLLALPAALRWRTHRPLAVGLAAVAAAAYVATWSVLIEASWFRELVLRLPYGDVYLHNPGRLRYLWLLIAPPLAAIGVHGFVERPLPARLALRWLGIGAGVFLALPLALGAYPARLAIAALGAIPAAPALVGLARGRPWAHAAVAGALAAELVGGALFAQAYEGGTVYFGLEAGSQPNLVLQPLRWPRIDAGAFLAEGEFVGKLRGYDRYLTWDAPSAFNQKGYLFDQATRHRAALTNERSTLFGVHDALGYNPVQLPRYWSFIRATDDEPVFYNASVLNEPTLEDLRLLGVRYLIVSRGATPPVPGTVVATEGRYALVEVEGWQPRASLVTRWEVVDRAVEALKAVLAPGFDPGSVAVLEEEPGIESTVPADGTVTYREVEPEDVRMAVDAAAPSVVLVRNNWDEGWSATVDGRPAPVLRADYFRQAVPVPAGRHEVRLTYRDPWIGRGLLASGLAWLVLAAALARAVGELRRRSSSV